MTRELITNVDRIKSFKMTILYQVLLVVFAIFDRTYGEFPPNVAATNRPRYENALPEYRFSYDVHNREGGQYGHRAHLDGRHTSGKYYVKLNGGTTQDVEYYTDQSGYYPKVSYRSNSPNSDGSGAVNVAFTHSANDTATNFSGQYTEAQSSTTSPNAIQTTEYSGASTSRSNNVFPFTSPKSVTDRYTSTTRPTEVSIYDFGLRLLTEGLRNNSASLQNEINVVNNEDTTSAVNPAPKYEYLQDLTRSSNTAAYFASIKDDSQHPTTIHNDLLSASSPQPYVRPISPPQPYIQPLDSQPSYIPAASPQLYDQSVSLPPQQQQRLDAQTNSDPIIPDFLTKLVSEVPAKLIRPIVVNHESKLDNKPDLTVDSAQPQQYNIPSQRVDNSTDNKNQEQTRTVVDVEPQVVQEHAVYTTTMDIAKSIPYSMTFVPDIDNHLQSGTNQQQPGLQILPALNYNLFTANPQTVMIPTVPPQLPFIPQMFVQPPATRSFPQHPLIPNAPLTRPLPTIAGTPPAFHYYQIPVHQQQPNVIPLNNYKINLVPENLAPANSAYFQPVPPNATQFVPPPALQDSLQSNSETVAKRENLFGKMSLPSANSIPIGFPFPPPYAVTAPPSQLIPYIKQITSYPDTVPSHPLAQHFFKQSTPVQPHSVYYNIKLLPNDVRSKRAPFKPSNLFTLWNHSDAYPIQQTRYIFDPAPPPPPTGTRKTRDSSSKRHLGRVKRLFVEYGGFKPPFVPSTPLKIDEHDDKNSQIPTYRYL